MADKAHRDTDKLLAKMERHLKQIYSEAEKEIEAKAAEYFARFEKQDAKKRKQVEDGKLTEDEYERWRKNKLLYGEKWNRERDRIAADLANVRSTALAYINGELPEVYATNYNFIGTDIESHVKGYSFDLVNPDTVRNLADEDKTFLPYKMLDGEKHKRWCTKAINSEILKGIMLGDSIPNLAKRLGRVTEMDKNAAVRNARTMVTSAENKARQDGFERATQNGIILKREWIAAIDGRTRHAHALLNGQLADPDKPFHSELGDIMYPGDPSAHPSNVYNCRCTLGSKIIGFEKQNGTGNVLISEADSDIIISGARITNPNSPEAIAHAERYYKEVRSFTSDVKLIAKNTGKSEAQIKNIKNYLFIDESLYDEDIGAWRRFDPDCAIAQTWQRLIDGKNILSHDMTLIEHELYEQEIKISNPGISHIEAHRLATQKYNYSKEADEYYGNLARNNKKQ